MHPQNHLPAFFFLPVHHHSEPSVILFVPVPELAFSVRHTPPFVSPAKMENLFIIFGYNGYYTQMHLVLATNPTMSI